MPFRLLHFVILGELLRTMLARERMPSAAGVSILALGICLMHFTDAAAAEQAYAQEESNLRAWARHTIDNSSRGADGVRLADANGDGLFDIATGWEEGGVTRVYLHPGHARCKQAWPSVEVGRTPSVEDAILIDMDNDGAMDVVSCCEGKHQRVYIHWAPNDATKYLDSAAWSQSSFPATEKITLWMYAVAMDVDGQNGIDLVLGGKGKTGVIGWLESPEDPRNVAEYRWHPLSTASWVMSLMVHDMDDDHDLDIVVSDRKRGPLRGCRWLENPGIDKNSRTPWPNHLIGGQRSEVMFMTLLDRTRHREIEAVTAARDAGIIWFRRVGQTWQQESTSLPSDMGTPKSVALADIDLDGQLDLVVSCENARGDKSGVRWTTWPTTTGSPWNEIAGPEGTKFDRIELVDVDGDGDRDVLTCEEAENLGVVWYENPCR